MTVVQICTVGLIGIVGILISAVQVQNSRFAPKILAVVEPHPTDRNKLKRIAIRIANKGGASGMIRFIEVIDGPNDVVREVVYVGWLHGEPFPFYLIGRASAEIIMEPGEGVTLLRYDKIKIGYGLNKEKYVKVKSEVSEISESCVLPPDSSPVSPPSEAGNN
ncbi:hypothetical protein ACFT4A_39450 [Streptomyces sp. NPDC057099]|uniref:hypothetical protein n=1 Tax=Streptomyces sp. NPDC057099 TaxID=3346019 RepID=UPI0036392F2C